ncbi:hypothetical protein TNCV_4826841 [Trichonephila clavipes]|nr:hypothetical protein TNCV_4826841 [Trichonephila clavipes]
MNMNDTTQTNKLQHKAAGMTTEKRAKSLVYADKPQTLDHLEDNIRRVIADIRPQMLEKVIENWTSRLDYIRASRGSPMPEIIFKILSNKYWLGLRKHETMNADHLKKGTVFNYQDGVPVARWAWPRTRSCHIRVENSKPNSNEESPCRWLIHFKSVMA